MVRFSNRKTSTNLGENIVIDYQHAPLLEEVANNMMNANTKIEGLSDPSWVRGGLPSRELNRDTEFYK